MNGEFPKGENVKTKDLGEVGELLSDVVKELKDFDEEETSRNARDHVAADDAESIGKRTSRGRAGGKGFGGNVCSF